MASGGGVGSGDLYDALQDFFAVCLAALADTADGAPDCAYVSEGPPAWDACPCLICWAGPPNVGDTFPLQPSLATMHRIELGRQVNLVSLNAIALRCQAEPHDDGTLPTPDEHAAVTRAILTDAWALWNHLAAAKRNQSLFPPKEREFSLEPGIAYNPQGAAAGSAITVRVQLDGYTPAGL